MGNTIGTSRQNQTITTQTKTNSIRKELQKLPKYSNATIQIDMNYIFKDVITLIEVFYRFKTMFDLIGPFEKISSEAQQNIEECQKNIITISNLIEDGVQDFHQFFQKSEEEGYKFLAKDSKFFQDFYNQCLQLGIVISKLVVDETFKAVFPISLPFFISGINAITNIGNKVDDLQQTTINSQTPIQS